MAERPATEADIEALYPEFTSVDSALITPWLEVTEELIDAECFGALQSQAQAMFTAHFIARIPNSGVGPSAPVTSKKIDKIQASYAVATLPTDQELSSTKYGIDFITLRDSILCGPIVAGPRDL
jgi:hypothetical protein